MHGAVSLECYRDQAEDVAVEFVFSQVQLPGYVVRGYASVSKEAEHLSKHLGGLRVINGIETGIKGSSDRVLKEVASTIDALKQGRKRGCPRTCTTSSCLRSASSRRSTSNSSCSPLTGVWRRTSSRTPRTSSIRSGRRTRSTCSRRSRNSAGTRCRTPCRRPPRRRVRSSRSSTPLQSQENSVRSLLAAARKLKEPGLNSSLIDQIIQAGPDAGLQIANELLIEGNSGIHAASHVQKPLTSLGKALGDFGANSLYKAGIDAADGLVAGLKSQEKALEAEMDHMAAGMLKAIKKALGIKSSSTVFRNDVGNMIGLGTAQGITSTRPHVAAATAGLVSLARDRGTAFRAASATTTGAPLIATQNISTADALAAARQSVCLLDRTTGRHLPAGA